MTNTSSSCTASHSDSAVSRPILFIVGSEYRVMGYVYKTFVTLIFGHSGWSHFIGNASYLLLLGPILEEKYGSKELIEVKGITAIAMGLVNYIFFLNLGLCGASGVAFAFTILERHIIMQIMVDIDSVCVGKLRINMRK